MAHALAADRPEGPYAKANGWYQVRKDVLEEMEKNKAHWTRYLGGPSEFDRAYGRVQVTDPRGSVPMNKWMSKLDVGPILANAYNRPFVFLSRTGGSTTYIPATVPPDPKPLPALFLSFFNDNHWIRVIVKRTPTIPFPLPKVSRLFHKSPAAAWLDCVSPSTTLHSLIPK